jgi:hypothetical protein
MPWLRGSTEWLGRRLSTRSRWFAAWALVGVLYSFAVIGLLSIGIFLLPIALIGTWVVSRQPRSVIGIPGVLAGLGIAPLFVALVNRDGPGQVCTTSATSSSCTQELSPWPWLIAGLVLLAVGIAWMHSRRDAAAG